MKGQGFLYGSAVLMLSAVLVKITGALFRIPLANMLGGTGMGYFSAAYSIFMPVYAVSVSGLPAAVARFTAHESALGESGEARAVKKTALLLFGLVGTAAMLVILLAAYPFCRYVSEDLYALPSIAAIAPSVLAGCLVSVYRGYYEGMRNMYPTAVSQVIEGASKLIFGLALCGGCLYLADNYPAAFLRLTGCEGRGISAERAAVPYSAAAAVCGITISSFAGLIYMIAADKRLGGGQKGPAVRHGGQRAAVLLRTALPAAVGALVINLTSLIDLVTIISSLRKTAQLSPQTFLLLTENGVSLSAAPNFIYGSFTGLAVTLFNLVPSLTNMFGKSMLPAAAGARAAGDKRALSDCAYGVLLAAALVSVPAGLGIAAMAEPVLRLLFSGRTLEIAVCADAMTVLGAAVPFLCISSAAFSVFQAIDRADIPVKIMGIGAAVKLAGNLLLTPIPALGVTGAALSTLVCYIIICGISAAAVIRLTYLEKGRITGALLRIFPAGIICAAAAVIISNGLSAAAGSSISTAAGCFFGGIIYIIITYFSGVITKSTVKTLIS